MSDAQTSWTKLNFIERASIPIMALDPKNVRMIKWIEFEAKDPNQNWIVESNVETIKFGGTFHSIYLRWNVAVNGLHKAADVYSSEQWLKSGAAFAVQGIRNDPDGSGPALTKVQLWDGKKAAEIHKTSVPMIAAWAFCNMYACLEEFVFRLYRIYLESHPMEICDRENFMPLRQMFQNRLNSEADSKAWEAAWAERLESWHRKKLYDGLGTVFAGYVQRSGLKIPGSYEGQFNYGDVAATLAGISLIRNGFIHGATKVSKELGDFCTTFRRGLFEFKEGDSFEITLHELAALEHFTDTFTFNLNTSFLERAWPELRLESMKKGKGKV
jgi:hypothetical protein